MTQLESIFSSLTRENSPTTAYNLQLGLFLLAGVTYRWHMSEDKNATVGMLSAYRDKIGMLTFVNAVRVVDLIADNMLAKFSRALDAVDCAGKILKTL